MFSRRRHEREMAEEMEAHLDGLTERNIAQAMSTDEAWYAAQRSFGGVEQIKERARDVRHFVWLEEWGRDLRFGVRSLRQTSGFTCVVLTIT